MAGVNLLQSVMQRPGQGRPRSGGRWGAVAGFAVAVVAACALVPWSWALHQEAGRLDRQLAAARQRVSRLRQRMAEADTLARTADALQQRIQAIEQIQRTRGERLRVLTAVSAALPDDCWLSTLADDESGVVRIDGRAADASSVFDFVRGIATSGAFSGGVEVLDSQTAAAAHQAGDSTAFVVRAVRGAPTASGALTPSRPSRPGAHGAG